MYLWRVFLIRPFAAVSVIICMATIYACWTILKRRSHHKLDRFLIGFLGLLSVYEGMRVLEACRLLVLRESTDVHDMLELVVVIFYLMAIVILRLSSDERLNTNLELRLARAAPPKTVAMSEISGAELERADKNLHQLAWALPQLSDGAFKLYTYLWIQAAQNSGRASVDTEELLSACGKSSSHLAACASELENLGAGIKFSSGEQTEVVLPSPEQIGQFRSPVAAN